LALERTALEEKTSALSAAFSYDKRLLSRRILLTLVIDHFTFTKEGWLHGRQSFNANEIAVS
jgi:hypothetical protein